MQLLINPLSGIVFFYRIFSQISFFFEFHRTTERAQDSEYRGFFASVIRQVSAGNLQFTRNAFRLITPHCSG